MNSITLFQMKWNKPMYTYLNWLLFEEINSKTSTFDDWERIYMWIEDIKSQLSEAEQKIVENKAIQMKNQYYSNIFSDFEGEYLNEPEDGWYDYPPIYYNRDFYDIWSKAVRTKKSLILKYDSTTSGITERVVNPYKTKSPYGIGYCHLRKEVRQFRFDRVIDIKMTEKNFEKPKDWEEKWYKMKNNWYE